jgi:hypothetical protein
MNPWQLLTRRRGATLPPGPIENRANTPDQQTSRRAILTSGAAAAGAAIASTVVTSLPAAASVAVKLAEPNISTAVTTIKNVKQDAIAKAFTGRVTFPGATGVFGDSQGGSGIGVRGDSNTGSTASGVVGNSTEGAGVRGNGTNNYGVYGTGGYCGTRGQGGTYGSIASGTSVGAYGSGSDYGLYGSGGSYGAYAAGGTYGVYGSGPTGVLGSGSTYGVVGTTTNLNTDAVRGSGGQYAVHGLSARSAGTRGDSGYVGAWGQANLYGVYGLATDGSATSYGVFGQASNTASYGIWCQGNMHVTGTLNQAAGSFKIDHPLDPERRWLSHSFVESPDMMNIYTGNAVVDGNGTATIKLPRYFDALNRDFRYQLTALGGPAPSLHVAREIAHNAFTIAGGVPGQKVSWQVTGIRQDDYAKAHPIIVEAAKTKAQLGTRQFVPRGSRARLMKVGPAQPKGREAPTPTDAPPAVKPL